MAIDISLFAGEIVDRIRSSELWHKESAVNGEYVKHIVCPECGHNEAFAYRHNPVSILCSRLKKCGHRTRITDHFPDILEGIETSKKPTVEDPNLPARYYLSLRGIKDAMGGLVFKYVPNIRKTGRGGVLFHVGTNADGKETWNGRFFNPPPGERKGAGWGSQDGMFWQHPGVAYDVDDPVYVTEGVLDALSLIEMGFQAIAILSSGRDVGKIDLSRFNNLVWAFDYDRAGRAAHRKWRKEYPESRNAAVSGRDWNDVLVGHANAKEARKWFDENIKEIFLYGNLAAATKAEEYADLWFDFYGRAPGLFPFNGSYWLASIKETKKEQYVTVTNVSNFTLRVDHYQLDNRNADEPVYTYHLKIQPQDRLIKPTFCTVRANEISSAASMTTLFLQRARAVWNGGQPAVVKLLRMITTQKSPVVRQLAIKGFDDESGCYVFRTFSITPAGKAILPNKQGIFEHTRKQYLRPAMFPDLEPATEAHVTAANQCKAIYRKLTATWGNRAAMCIAWVVASWFVKDIKERTRFFPILSMFGEPGTGKSNLVIYMNAMQCIDEEGAPMKDVNTAVGITRTLSQRSCLFQALLEDDKKRTSKFDYRTILTAYNDAPLQIKGMKTTDNRTENLMFRGAIAFVQNREPFEAKEEKERVVSVKFLKDMMSDATKAAFDSLMDVPKSHIAAFYPVVMRKHNEIRKGWFGKYQEAKQSLKPWIIDNRINENHAIVLAFHGILCELLGISYDMTEYIGKVGQIKESACSREQGPIADYFFDVVMTMIEDGTGKDLGLFVAKMPELDEFRLHLPSVLKIIHEIGYPLNVRNDELQDALEKHTAFIERGKVCKYTWNSLAKTNSSFVFRLSVVEKCRSECENPSLMQMEE